MEIHKSHFYGLLAILVVAAVFAYIDRTNVARNAQGREKDIASCVREVTRDAYEASGFLTLADRVKLRNNEGDEAAAMRYRAAALSIADTFPKAGTTVNSEDMIAVQFLQGPGDEVRLKLTDPALKLIADGCRQAF